MAILKNVKLTDSTLTSISLQNVTVAKCTLKNLTIEHSTISASALTNCRIIHCTIKGSCAVKSSKLHQCKIHGTDGISGCELQACEILSDCAFQMFPVEIRKMIFKMYFQANKGHKLIAALRGQPDLYHEALEIFRMEKWFIFHLGDLRTFRNMPLEIASNIRKMKLA